ncbi:MAG: type II secretion system F family protein [Anaerolineaceae bacterium]|nr:type II secretion system F family protein [Anaerolineaceae bacterium]
MIKNGPASKKQKRITRFVDLSDEDKSLTPIRDSKLQLNQDIGKLRNWINASLSSLSSEKLKIKLSSAYSTITDTEYLLIRYVGAGVAFILGWLIPGNFLGGIFLGGLTIMLPPIVLDRAIAKRQQRFHEQLLDVLIMIKGAVQAGYSLIQALDMAVNEIPAPASEEFKRVMREIRFGLTLEEALNNLAERMANDDVQIVVTAIIINAQVGGNLSTVLESTISTIRDRMQLFGEIRSLTAYARYVGNFLTLLPFLTGIIIFMLSPGYFDSIKTSIITQLALGFALFGVIGGNIWIKRIVKIKV